MRNDTDVYSRGRTTVRREDCLSPASRGEFRNKNWGAPEQNSAICINSWSLPGLHGATAQRSARLAVSPQSSLLN